MARLIRKTIILAETETNYGVDPSPTGADNAILISNASYSVSYNSPSRDFLRPYLGNSGQLVGTRFVEMQFDCELANSGTAGTKPAWSPLLEACGLIGAAETVPTRVEYAPISSGFKSVTIYYHADGAKRIATGCVGNAELMLMEGEIPKIRFSFVGLDGGVSAASDPTPTLTAWQIPAVPTQQNTGALTLGCTYATGALSGGTAYPSRGISINVGNGIGRKALIGGQSVGINRREMSASCQLELTAAQEATLMTAVAANTPTSLGMTHQTGAGVGMLIFAPVVQRIDPRDTDYEGDLHTQIGLRFLPSSGNDEFRLVML